jgi:hypothetical protein
MPWVLQSEVLVDIVPRDSWIYRPIPSSPNTDPYSLTVRPTEDLGANVNAAGFFNVTRESGNEFSMGRSWIIHFQAPRNAGFRQLLNHEPAVQLNGHVSTWYCAVSLPTWFPPTNVGIWKWMPP